MKIEKIRFKNLASLAGEWKIDLSNSVFTDAGIFALSGPVGSGKSTIFDAVRLALYGRTSRLDRVNKSDNEIMTRGTKECFAEVIFSNEKGRFISRWSQHRASRSNELQNAKHELSELKDGAEEGKILTSKLEETRKRIIELTGMDFAHFSRAMILPQGQFANFLRATPDERSPILEQITGTGIYAEISAKAHELARGHRQELEALEQSVSGIEILSEERIKEINDSIQEKSSAELSIKKQYDSKAEILKVVKSLDSEAENCKRLKDELSALERELAEAKQNCGFAEEQKTHAKNELDILAPLLLQVRALDTQISVRKENLQKALNEFGELKKKKQNNEKSLLIKENDLKKKLSRIDELREELKKRSADAALGQELNAIELLCSQTEQLEHGLKESETLLKNLKKERKKLETALADAQSALEKQNKVYNEAIEQFRIKDELLNSLLKGVSITEFFAKKESVAAEVRKLEELDKKFKDAESFRNQLAELQKTQDTITKERNSVSDQLKSLEELKNALEQNIVLLEQQKLAQIKIASLEEHRKALEDGKACPLCGSVEHPYVHDLPEFEPDKLTKAKENFKKTESDITSLQKALSQHEIQLAQNEEKRIQLAKNLEDALSGLSDNHDSVIQSLRKAEAELTHYNTVGAMIDTALNERNQAQKVQEEAQKLSHTLSEKAGNAGNQLAALVSKYETAEKTHNEKAEQYAKQRNELNERLSGFGVEFSAEKSPVAILRERFAEYEKLVADEKNITPEITRISTEIQTGKEHLASLAENLTTREKTVADQKNELDELNRQRKEFFGEKNPSEEEKKAADALKQAETNLLAANKLQQELSLKNESKKTSIKESENRTAQSKAFLAEHKVELPADTAAMEISLKELDEQRRALMSSIGESRQLLEQHRQNMERSAVLLKQIEAKRIISGKWDMLNELIGSADGKKFRLFVQSLTFETLIGLANEQLVKFSDHYFLTADKESGLEFDVIDRYRGDEIRSTRNLSGGETFLVSLALALGLSRMTRDKVRIDTLFLDEGFGTLDADTLQHALEQLAGLRQGGKLIGIISHAQGISSAVPVVLHLENNCGRSTIEGLGVTFVKE